MKFPLLRIESQLVNGPVYISNSKINCFNRNLRNFKIILRELQEKHCYRRELISNIYNLKIYISPIPKCLVSAPNPLIYNIY